jgi:lysyl endopeptidase
VPMLNAAYNSWKAGTVVPGMTRVYRFYNKKNGSHFYTASETERNNVLSTLSATYSLDGVAYSVNTLNAANNAPLYRFFNKKNGSHFYTSSLAEKNSVQANLSATYAYDGPAYNVCMSPPADSKTVYRFFNKRNGSHFYTASEAEKNTVLATLSAIYALDGPAFYLAP